jgi:uncharacterized membrane protein YeaQ/YmgE (transglycosylase-associated protein family)
VAPRRGVHLSAGFLPDAGAGGPPEARVDFPRGVGHLVRSGHRQALAAAGTDEDNHPVDAPTGIISALITGIVIGLLGRAVVPARRRAPIGCLMTILIGLLGAALGLVVAEMIDAAWLLTLLLQVAIAALLVVMVSAAGGRGRG